METRHLELADRNIAGGEARLERQRALIERLRRVGAATTDAENFLGLLRDTLAGWRRERKLIVAELERPSGR